MRTIERPPVAPGVAATGPKSACAEIRQSREAVFRKLVLSQASIIVVRAGAKIVRWPGGPTLRAEAGDAIALSAGQVADVLNRPSAQSAYRADVVSFADDLLEQARPPGPAAPCGCFRAPAEFELSLARCKSALAEDSELPPAIREHRLRELLVWLAGFGIGLQPAATGLSMSIRRLVQDAPQRAWTSGDIRDALAGQGLAMSEATLRRRLASTGETLRDLVADARMTVALSRLQSGAEPVAEIAADCGYDSPSRFSVRFRSRFGVSPSEIRGHSRGIDRNGTEPDRDGTLAAAAQ